MTEPDNRCRLVLIVPDEADADQQAKQLAGAMSGGDVASVILPQYGLDDQAFQKRAEKLVQIIQDAGAAAIISGDSRVAGRAKADGLHMAGSLEELGEACTQEGSIRLGRRAARSTPASALASVPERRYTNSG